MSQVLALIFMLIKKKYEASLSRLNSDSLWVGLQGLDPVAVSVPSHPRASFNAGGSKGSGLCLSVTAEGFLAVTCSCVPEEHRKYHPTGDDTVPASASFDQDSVQ